MKNIINYCLTLTAILVVVSCDPWDDHVKTNEPALGQNIFELIKSDASLSTFANIIDICGYDSVLSTGNTFTVFAVKNENITGIDLTDTVYLKKVLRNHIAYLSYGLENGTLKVNAIKMINGKYNSVSGNILADATIDVSSSNRICGNGILHILDKLVEPLDNIWEKISVLTGYDQVNFVKSLNTKVMDPDKSIQIGFNSNSQPIYDTVFYNVNEFLDRYGLDNEDSAYTFILLNNVVLNRLQNKYKKYFTFSIADSLKEKKTVNYEISRDMTLLPVQVSASQNIYKSADGIEIDLSADSVITMYQASNGRIYVMSGANVRMYNNKIKSLTIEGEDFVTQYSQNNTEASIRIRSFASGGRDVMLSGWSRMYTYVNGSIVTHSPYNNLTDAGTLTRTWNYYYNTSLYSNITNAYFEYHPLLYSVPYKIYWVAYDDITGHYTNFTDTLQPVFELEQKLFVSFAGRPPLARGSSGEITNNNSSSTVFAGVSHAGQREEVQLFRYSTDNSAQMLLDKPTTFNPNVPQDQLICPFYGVAKAWVTNSPRTVAQFSGMIFLDYIKFEPVIDPNE